MTGGPRTFSVITYLSNHEALALAQLVKRIKWSDFEPLAVDRSEAEVMREALEQLRRSLADSGYDPR